MRWAADSDIAAYAQRVVPHLLTDPVRNNVAFTLVQGRLDGGLPADQGRLGGGLPVDHGARWLYAEHEGAVVGVALQTPPHALLLTGMSFAALDALVEHLAAAGATLPGVAGPTDLAGRFAAQWSALPSAVTNAVTNAVTSTPPNAVPNAVTSTPPNAVPNTPPSAVTNAVPRAVLDSQSRLFVLDAVRPPVGVPGRIREATAGDRDLLISWSTAFHREAVPREPEGDTAAAVDARLRKPGLVWLWEVDGTAVSTAYLGVPAAGVVRVSGVYTPADRRRRGYASACVAAMSRYALDNGATACMLYTDLANPTSNKIYQMIGYRPVSDAALWRFAGPA